MAAEDIQAPELLDLTIDNITPNTIKINNQTKDARLKYLMERLVTHLHDFARETRLSTEEWMTALTFLIQCGQICSDVRNEFILLSDVLGLSLLVDNINHPKPPASTEGSVLGPFHTHDAPTLANGAKMSSDPEGELMLALCSVKDTAGKPVPGVKIDIWETDSSGHYDVQHSDRGEPSERCVMVSDAEGKFWFKGIKPVSYPIPHDGPVGKLLQLLGRHCWRPAHVHFMFEKEGWDHLITALYLRGDPYETSDAVFGVKKSLVIDLDKVDKKTAEEYGVPEGTWLLKQEFVLITEKESLDLRDRLAEEALKNLGLRMKLVDHLPVPDLD
ncbi:hypothetical protein VMCG_01671 [Cytospora schulzeri]|uniref:Intradiol ring-cleavage dioxygenases domain-containing protein n=1 Tax=Cytospora schulzeri TaxID=448051 RepID=A0A423X2V4_9PEZI|nr:hypothetical protein VMCG_01671 [Valsa malicola]